MHDVNMKDVSVMNEETVRAFQFSVSYCVFCSYKGYTDSFSSLKV